MPIGRPDWRLANPARANNTNHDLTKPDEEAILRIWFSHLVSGLEHFYESLWVLYRHDPATRTQLLHLGLRCLSLQTCLNILAWATPKNMCTTFNQLFFPTVLLYRYLHPQPFDSLFMTTVRALGSADRSDIVAKRGPRYLVQLKQYIYRTFRAYLAIGTVHWLVDRRGIFAIPSILLGLIAVFQYLRSKGVRHAMVKLLVAVVFVGPRWPVWVIQISVLQQLFMYELLQPYLARVQFKGYEERAWLAMHEVELQGFALGVWLVCSVPWVGVAALPAMFPAVAVLLTRSCGVLENLGASSSTGDVIERRWPGVKAVALGRSDAVRGDWDSTRVETFVKNPVNFTTMTMKFESHDKNGSVFRSVDRGTGGHGHETGHSTAEQIRLDIEASQERKADLYRDAELRVQQERQKKEQARTQQQQQQRQQQQTPQIHLELETSSPPVPWSVPTKTLVEPQEPSESPVPASDNSSDTPSDNPSSTPTSSPLPKQATPSAPSAPPAIYQAIAGDITSYNFSDRKTVETAPSAPPAPSEHPLNLTSQQDLQRWLDYYAQQPYQANAQGTSGHRVQRSDPGVWPQAGSSRSAPQQHWAPRNRESGEDEHEAEEADEAKETEREVDKDDAITIDNDMIPLKSRRHSQDRLSGSNAGANPSPAYSETRPYSEGSQQSPYQEERAINYNVNKPLPRIVEDRTRTHQRRSYSSPEMELQGESDSSPQQRSHGKSPRRGAMGKLPSSGIRMPTSTGLSTEIAQSLMALEETIDQAFETLGDSWVQKIQRATTTPVQAAVNHAATNAVAAVNHATTNAVAAVNQATTSAEKAKTAAAMAAGVWADEKAKLVTAAGEQREKIKVVFGPWSKEF